MKPSAGTPDLSTPGSAGRSPSTARSLKSGALTGMPVSAPLFKDPAVEGLRPADPGVDKSGVPADGFMAGMDVRAQLTVVGDGPVGAIGQALDQHLGLPEGHARREWALGMKMVIELPEDSPLEPGTVWHS